MKKVLLPTNDLYLQFTEEELTELNIVPGDKFDVKLQEDGSIKLEKYVKLELDTEDWPVDLLQLLIKESCEKDISVNDVLCNLLEQALDNLDLKANEK
jgi:hypothetical protein